MSNHCYRNTLAFQDGLKTALSWCEAQDWVPVEYATGILPFYMAYATRASGGVVVALHEKSVVRGCLADEAMYQEYSDGGNVAFYGLLVYDTFSRATLHRDIAEFEELRQIYRRVFVSGFFSILTNRKIRFGVLLKTMRHCGVRFRGLLTREIILSIMGMIRLIPGLRGYQLRRRGKSHELQDTSELIANFTK